MGDDRCDFPAAIACAILDLLAELAGRFALPGHLDGGKTPFRVTRYSRGIVVLLAVAGKAAHACSAKAAIAPNHKRAVRMATVALQRPVARGVAIDTARMLEDLAYSPRRGPPRLWELQQPPRRH